MEGSQVLLSTLCVEVDHIWRRLFSLQRSIPTCAHRGLLVRLNGEISTHKRRCLRIQQSLQDFNGFNGSSISIQILLLDELLNRCVRLSVFLCHARIASIP